MKCMLTFCSTYCLYMFDYTEADRVTEMGESGGDRLCWQWILYRPGHLHYTGRQEGEFIISSYTGCQKM